MIRVLQVDRDTEVTDLAGGLTLRSYLDQDVVQLDVSVQNFFSMQVLDSFDDLREYVARL